MPPRRNADEICEIKGRLAMVERNLRRVLFFLFVSLLCLLAKSPLDQIMLFNQARNMALEQLGKPSWLGVGNPSKPTPREILEYLHTVAYFASTSMPLQPAPWGKIAKTVTNHYYQEAFWFYLHAAHDPETAERVEIIATIMAAGVLVLFVYVNLRNPGTVLTIAATMAAGVVLLLFAMLLKPFNQVGSAVIAGVSLWILIVVAGSVVCVRTLSSRPK